jgi:hypothetical protein
MCDIVITVATSEYVYVYKNLRPFFRAVLPPLPINQVERDIWIQVHSIPMHSICSISLTNATRCVKLFNLNKNVRFVP